MMKCDNCGNEVLDNALFCDNCGQKIIRYSNKPEKCFCGKCGAEIEAKAEFCGNCGNPVDTSDNIGVNYIFCDNCGAKWPGNVQVCSNCGYKMREDNYEQISERYPKKKKSVVLIVLFVLAILLLAILGMIAGYFFYVNSEDDKTNDNSVGIIQKKSETPVATDLLRSTASPVSTPNTIAGAPLPTASPTPYATPNNDISQSTADYLFNSDKEYISEAYLNTQSQQQVRLILNEMYARHGYIFTLDEYKQYFSAKAWYKPKYTSADEAESHFNDIEKANKTVIVNYEISKNWR